MECADAVTDVMVIVPDGGITCPGDCAKAFGAGADFVMLGSMLAGHKDLGGELFLILKQRNNIRYFMVCRLIQQ